jgi:2-(3-amino-3-carboxypropyl)histidine synthase
MKTLSEINEEYDLELERIVKEIEKNKAKRVLLQFPDGMKPYSNAVVEYLEGKTEAELFIWMGSCFGACDTPDIKEIDLLIQFGHSSWKS